MVIGTGAESDGQGALDGTESAIECKFAGRDEVGGDRLIELTSGTE